ncbi:MAG: methyltransferase domain-containing protein [Acidobacteria bacterium]|nr:methyltransferase domain-containing protein [Acidobacteriota bacterium]
MIEHTAARQRRSSFRAHVLLGLLILSGIAVVAHWPAARTAAWVIVAGLVAAHVGLALLALLGAGLGIRFWLTRSTSQGQTIRWASFYDVLVTALTLGRARVFREAALDLARVSPGERVLDVGCGTGSLALAAKRRVGAGGAVHGVDAAAEMVARAKQKAVREGLEVTFDVAPAQALPFPDGAFDLVLCTLMMHHLPDGGRKQAIAEMRRVLKPGGRLLVVDLAHEKGLLAALTPISLIHGHDAMHAAEEAEALMRDAGFSDIVTGKVGLRVVGYALGRAGKHDV